MFFVASLDTLGSSRLVMVLSYLNSKYVFYMMYADNPLGGASQYNLPNHIYAGVEAIVNQLLVLELGL